MKIMKIFGEGSFMFGKWRRYTWPLEKAWFGRAPIISSIPQKVVELSCGKVVFLGSPASR